MGGDCSPASLLQAILSFADSLPTDIQLIVLAPSEYTAIHPRVAFHTVSEWITMEENPLTALRQKKRSSIHEGLRLVKEKKANAFISAGSTGALVVAAKVILGTVSKMPPALIGLVPTKKKPVALLDLGAHLDAKETRLTRLALLGFAYQKARGISHPKVALLNIGTEALKGTSSLKKAYQKLKKNPFFAGNIEGSSVFEGDVDVVVTDGFTGNIFLKTAEGAANLVLNQIGKKSDLIQQPYSPAALLAGLQQTVVKCHSYASEETFVNAIRTTIEYAVSQFTEKLKTYITQGDGLKT